MLRRLLFFFSAFILSLSAFSQTYTLEVERALTTNKDSVLYSYFIRSSAPAVLGSGNFVFEVDTFALDYNNLTVVPGASAFDESNDFANYNPIQAQFNNLQQRLILTVQQKTFALPAPANNIGTTNTFIGSIRILIKDKCAEDTTVWTTGTGSTAIKNWIAPVSTTDITLVDPAAFLLHDSISGNLEITAATDTLCEGSLVDIGFTLNGEGPFDVSFVNNGPDDYIENATTGAVNSYAITNTGDNIFSIDTITDVNGCIETDATFFVDDTAFVDQIVTPAAAGPDDVACSDPGTITLAANTPIIGNGLWTSDSPTMKPVFTTDTDPTTVVTIDSAAIYELYWTISSPIDGALGACPSSEDTVLAQIDAVVDTAFANPDSVICAVGGFPINLNLYGNSPTVGSGMWTISNLINGVAPSIDDDTLFNSQITFTDQVQVELTWEIVNGVCPAKSYQVTFSIENEPPVPNITSAPLPGCDLTLSLNASNTFSNPIVGSWSSSDPGVAFTTPVATSTDVTFPVLTVDSTYEVYWSITNNFIPSGCPTDVDTLPVTIFAQPDVSNTIVGNALPNCGATENYTVTPIAGSDFSWNLPLGFSITAVNSPDSSDIDITLADPSFAGDIEVTEITANGCIGGVDTIAVTPQLCIQDAQIAINSVANSDTAVCRGDAVLLISNSSGINPGVTDYSWDTARTVIPSPWTPFVNNDINADTITVTFNAAGTWFVYLEMNNPGPELDTLQLQVVKAPTLDFIHLSPNTLCEGDTSFYSLTIADGLAPYTVTLDTGGGTVTFNNLDGQDTVALVLNGSTTVSATGLSDQLNCAGGSIGGDGPQNVSINPSPTATISSLSGLNSCTTDSIEVQVDFTLGTAPFDIKINLNGTLDTTITGILTDPYQVFLLTDIAGANTFTLDSITDANGCSSASGTGNAFVNTDPGITNLSITGGATICEGENDTILFEATGGTANYTFFYQGNAGTVSADSLFEFIYAPSADSTVTLDSVSDVNGCAFVLNASVTTTVNPLPSADIAGTATICSGESTDLVFTGANPTDDIWFSGDVDGQLPVQTGSGNVTVSPTVTNIYTIDSVVSALGCIATIAPNVTGSATVTVNPGITAYAITGGDNICAGEFDTINVTITGGTGPFTIYIDGVPPIAGYNSGDDLTFNPPATFQWDLDSVRDALGCFFADASINTTTTVNAIPTAAISGDATICETDPTNLTFNFTPIGNTFEINYTDGVNIFNATGLSDGATIAVSPSSDSTYTLLSVLDEITGCFDTVTSVGITGSATIMVNSNANPTVSLGQDPPSPFCDGEAITFTATGTDTTATPTWSWFINDVLVGGATTNTFTTSTLNDADEVKVVLDVSGPPNCATDPIVADSVIVDEQTAITPSVTLLQFPSNPVCNTDTVTLIADIFGGGNPPTALNWRRNGAIQFPFSGQDTIVLTPANWNDGDVFQLTVFSSLACASPTTATTNITINSSANVTPTVTLNQNPANPLCAGDPVTLTTTVGGEGASPIYTWFINGLLQPDTTSFITVPAPVDEDEIKVVLNSSASCATNGGVAQDSVLLDVVGSVSPLISFTQSPAGAVCPGVNIDFTANYSGGGSTPQVQWFVNGVLEGIGDNFTLVSPSDGDVVDALLISSAGCALTDSATSQSTITVQNPVFPDAEIIQVPDNPVCIGDEVEFIADVTGEGNNPIYEWYYNGSLVGSGTSYTQTSVANNDSVRLVLINNQACSSPITSDEASVVINAAVSVPLTATIERTPAGTELCENETVTFSVNLTGGGSNPSYNWSWPLRFGGAIQSTDPTWVTSDIQTGLNFASVSITSSLSCASPTTIQPGDFFVGVTAGAGVTPTVDLVQNPGNPVCTNDPVDFSVSATGEGTSPLYEFFLNGASQVTNSTGLYTLNTPSDGDIVVVQLTSNICGAANTARDTVIINQQTVIDPTVEIDVNPDDTICGPQFVTFTAIPTGQGSNPNYQWFINNTLVSTAISFTEEVEDNDEVVVVLTKTLPCGGVTEARDTVLISVVSSIASVDIIQNQSQICNGDIASFSAIVQGISISRTYLWRLDGDTVGTGPTVNVAVNNGQSLRLDVNSPISICGNASSAFDVLVVNTITGTQTPSTSIDIDPGNPICPDENLILSTVDTFEGANPSYKWYVNSMLEVLDDVFLTNELVDGDTVVVEMQSDASCASPNKAYDTIEIKYIRTDIDTADTTSFCFGEDSVTLSIEDTMNVSAIWYSLVSGMALDTGYSITINDSDSVYALISNGRCEESTDTIGVTVYKPYGGSITPDGPTTGLCDGDDVTLTVLDSAGLQFQWLYGFDTIVGETDTILTVDYSGSFNILVQNFACIDTIGSVNVQIEQPIDSVIIVLEGDTIFCEGDSVLLGIPSINGNGMIGSITGTGYVNTTFAGVGGNSPRTLEALMLGDTTGIIMGYGTASAGQAFVVRTNDVTQTPGEGPDGALKVLVGSGYITGTTDIADATVHHIAVVFAGDSLSDIQLYVDGQMEVISSSSANIEVNTGASIPFRIGNAAFGGIASGPRLRGAVDEVRFWDAALDSATINNNKDIELSGNEPGLVGYWNFEDTTGNTVKDLAQANDGAFVNGARFANNVGLLQRPIPANAYEWYINGNAIAGSDDFEFWADSTGDYYVEVTINGCTQISDTITVEEIILDPQIVQSGPIDACFGDVVTLNSINTSPLLDSIAWISGTNSGSLDPDSTFDVTATGVYSVVYYREGCSDTSDAIVVNIAPEIDTTLTIIGDTVLCEGDTTILAVPLYGGNHLRGEVEDDDIRNIGGLSDFNFIHETGRFTLQYWQRINSPASARINVALGNEYSGAARGFFAGVERNVSALPIDRDVKLHLSNGSGVPYAYYTTGIPPFNNTDWHQVTISFDEGMARIWVDGVERSVGVDTTGGYFLNPGDASDPLQIGNAPDFLPLNITNDGGVEEVRIWDYPLDSATVANNWNRPLNGNEPGLVALFDLDEDSASMAGDNVQDLASGFIGTLNGGALLSADNGPFSPDSLSYQWYKNDTAIVGAISNVLSVGDAGDYYAVITSSIGACDDTTRTITIEKYEIDAQIDIVNNDTVCFGDSVELEAINVDLSGIDSVQWLYSGLPISTDNPYTIGLSGAYQSIVYLNVCSDTSAIQDVVILPEIDNSVSIVGDTTLCEGDSVILDAAQYGSSSLHITGTTSRLENVAALGTYDFVHQTGDFAIEFQAKLNDFSKSADNIVIGSSWGLGGGNGFSAGLTVGASSAGLRLIVISNGIRRVISTPNNIINDTQWHHYAISGDSGNVRMFIDGVEITSLTPVTANFTLDATASTNQASIGYPTGTNASYFNGLMDEIRVWNFPITEEQINANIGRPINGNPALVSLFNFDVDTGLSAGDIITDAYGNGTGTLFGPNITTSQDNPFLPGDLSYSWYKDGALFAGPNTNTELVVFDSGTYQVSITNSFGCDSVTSRPIIIQQNLISDTLFATPTEFCFGTDSARIWVDLNAYDSVEIYDTADVYITTLTNATDTFYADTTGAFYGIVYNTLDDKICSQVTNDVFITAFENPTVSFFSDSLIICIDDSATLFTFAAGDTTFGGTGFGTYTYQWEPSDSLSNDTILNAVYVANAPGDINFILTVTDANGCIGVDSIRAITYPRVVVDLGIDTIEICYGDTTDLGAGLVVTGGHPDMAYLYQWDNDTLFLDAGNDSVSNPLVSGLVPGTYTYVLTVFDSITGCSGSDTITLFVNDSIYFNVFTDSLICFNTDSIQLGGVPSAFGGLDSVFAYSWDPITNLSSGDAENPYFINPMIAGTYTYILTATDSLGCSRSSDTISIEVAPEVIVDAGLDTVACFGDTTITIGGAPTASGGFNAFAYSWDVITVGGPNAGDILDDTTASNPTIIYTAAIAVPSVEFVVTVYDTSASETTICEMMDTVLVVFNPEIIANVGTNDFICFEDTIALNGSATGGSSTGFTFAWAGDNQYLTDTTDENTNFIGTGSGLFFLELFANDVTYPQCFDTDTFTFEVNDTILMNAGNDTLICYGQEVELGALIDGTSDTTASNAVGGFVYNWSGITALLSSTNIKNPIFNQSGVTSDSIYTYIVDVVDGNLCANVDTIVVQVNPQIFVDPGFQRDSICVNDSITLGGLDVAIGGINPFTYQWSSLFGSTLITDTDENPIYIGDSVGIDSIKIIVTDNRGCFDSAELIVEVNDLPDIAFSTANAFYICRGEDTLLTAIGTPVNGPNNPLDYIWNNGALTASTTVSPFNDSTYVVEVLNTLTGCSSFDSVAVEVRALPNNQIVLQSNPIPSDTVLVCSNFTFAQLTTINDSSTTVFNDWEILNPPPVVSNPTLATILILVDDIDPAGNIVAHEAIDNNGCVNYDTVFLSKNNLPNAVFSASDTIICYGDTVELSVTGGPDPGMGALYLFNRFTPTVSNIAAGTDTLVTTVPGFENPVVGVNTDTILRYRVEVQDGPCASELALDIYVNPLPLLNPINDAITDSVCFGQDVLLTMENINPDPVPLDSFVWAHTPINNDTVIATILSDSAFSVVVYDTNGCFSSTNYSIEVKALPDTTVLIAGNDSICEGVVDTLIGVDVAGYTYDWKDLTQPGVILGNNFELPVDTSGQYYVVITTDGIACQDSSSARQIYHFDLPAINIDTIPADSSTFCFGDSLTLIETSGYVTTVWKDLISGDVINNNIFVADTTVSAYVIVTDVFGCTDSSFANPIDFTEFPLVTDDLNAGDTTPCAYSTESYNTALYNGFWLLPDTAGVIQGGVLVGNFYLTTTPSNTVTIDWLGSGNTQLQFIPNVPCSDTSFYNITINPNPLTEITGPTSFCETETPTFISVNPNGPTSQWSLTLGSTFGTIINYPSRDSIDLTLNPITGAAASFEIDTVFLTQILATGCDTTASFEVTKFRFADAEYFEVGQATVDTNVCVGEQPTFDVLNQIPGSPNYTYSLLAGSPNLLTQVGTQAFVEWTTPGTDTLFLISDNGDCSDTFALGFSIQESPNNLVTNSVFDDATLIGTNEDTVCGNIDSLLFSVSTANIGSNTLNWFLTGGGTATSTSSVDSSFYAVIPDSAGNTQFILTYTETSTNGCSYDTSITVRVSAQPVLTTASGNLLNDSIPKIFCEGSSGFYTFAGTYDDINFTPVDTSIQVTFNNQTLVVGSWGQPNPNAYLEYTVLNEACAITDTIFFQVDTLPVADIRGDIFPLTEFCENDITRFTAVPLDSNYSYQWYLDGNALTGGDTSTIIVNDFGSGTYTVVVSTQAAGCRDSMEANEGSVVNILQSPDAEIVTSNDLNPDGITNICSGDSVELSLVNSAFIVEWYRDTLNTTLVATDVDEIWVDQVFTQWFAVLINDPQNGNGCTDTSNIVFVEPLIPAESFWSIPDSITFCNNDTIRLDGAYFGDSIDFEWSTDNGFGLIVDPTTDTTLYIPSPADSSFVNIYFSVENDCDADIDTSNVLINKSPNAEYTPSTLVAELNETVIFTPDNPNAVIYDWVYRQGASGSGQIGSYQYTQEGDYLTYMIATNEFNCVDSFALPIHVTRNQLIYIPNVFSPNAASQENRVMKIYGTNISSQGFEIVIFNRWGTKVFETTDLTQMKTIGWEGTLSGAELPSGVYTYYINGQFFNGEPFQQVGTVSLIR